MSKVPLTKEGEIILKERLTKLKFVDRLNDYKIIFLYDKHDLIP